MTIDEAGQHQVAADIEDRQPVREGWLGVLTERGDTPTGDPDIDEMPVGKAAVGQNSVEVHLCPWSCPRSASERRSAPKHPSPGADCIRQ